MLLCLDIGNSQIFAGVYVYDDADDCAAALHNTKMLLHFRHETQPTITSDQFGAFLKSVLRENNIDACAIRHIALSSVVPGVDYSLRAACKKYFNIEPFCLSAAAKTGLVINTSQPAEIGADLLAGAIAAIHYYPRRNVIIADLGTATTITAVSCRREFLGGAFIAGLRLSMEALSRNTAKLFPVEIVQPTKAVGRSTSEALQAGLYYGHLGAIKEIIAQVSAEIFSGNENFVQQSVPVLVATGGFAYLFEKSGVFYDIKPNLVLDGLRLAYILNSNSRDFSAGIAS